MTFSARYNALNTMQRQAVDTIDGPLLVIAGPGTGKTELLSMRAAAILQHTDTLPSSILCLTFTDSGAVAMRERLSQIIGSDAYKIAIHTFHSFGSEIINQHGEYFFRGAQFTPADELAQYEILREIFGELDYTNPLSGMNGNEYTHLADTRQAISELKRSGLASEELRAILDANDAVIDAIEADINQIFEARISNTTIQMLAPLAEKIAAIAQPPLPPAITPYTNVLALSLAHAFDQAVETNSTKPITAWKNTWCEKNDQGATVLRDRRRHDKLRAVAHVYHQYISRMEAAARYDYDDMILQVIHAMETSPDLRANLQEKFHYIMVDEFQDTNLAQLRLLFDITGTQESPNIMAVGDDDQAIYSFQGADIGNIQRFRTHYSDPTIIVLKDNYRSSAPILNASRAVITQGTDRLEHANDSIDKTLKAHHKSTAHAVEFHEYASPSAERAALAANIKTRISRGTDPSSIAVLARRHHELVALLPYLQQAGIHVDYERRENVLEHDVIRLLEHLLLIIDALHRDEHQDADALLPEILAHPAWGYDPIDIYKLSLNAYRSQHFWLEAMLANPVFEPLAQWLIVRSAAIHVEALETQIDELLGVNTAVDGETMATDDASYRSPLGQYFFSDAALAAQPDAYLSALESLRTLRDQLREHYSHEAPSVRGLLEFLDMHHELGTQLTAVRHRSETVGGRVHLMSAHKSKGLEFDHVYIIGAIDSAWGERVRSRSRLIGYPANLPLAPAGDSYDERLRLFFVAMTRARRTLRISYSAQTDTQKPSLIASFLSTSKITPTVHDSADDIGALTTHAELDWRGQLTRELPHELRELLAPTLERYKLSATHLGNFLDVSQGGPQRFLLNNLLRFPQAKSAHASYGTAMHATLQRAHDFYRATGERRPLEDILGDFERILHEQHMSEADFDIFYQRGLGALSAFLSARYDSFAPTQRTELNFGAQGVMIGEARLTGTLDLVDIDLIEQTIRVTDYKTGRASRGWKGRTDYERIKLHKYRQQLMFYQLLCENSRDFSSYRFSGGCLQFIEPTQSGDIVELESVFSDDDVARFRRLIDVVWHKIITLDLPDVSGYPATYKGVLQFEQDLLDSNADIV
ncbi:hypothetical protein CR983_01670 [Candidatus Saccharibacteria bacterium]|nr:MAG: hypothetical protein CR983_01670 [Candidatus Saccharibacteria bacterium]